MNMSSYGKLGLSLKGLEFSVEDYLTSDAVRNLVEEVGGSTPNIGVEVQVTIRLTENTSDRELDVFDMYLSKSPGEETALDNIGFNVWLRYMVADRIVAVPAMKCPGCWGGARVVDGEPCTGCGLTLGRDCRVILDADSCPVCFNGVLSQEQPTCSSCGHTPDPAGVVWG